MRRGSQIGEVGSSVQTIQKSHLGIGEFYLHGEIPLLRRKILDSE